MKKTGKEMQGIKKICLAGGFVLVIVITAICLLRQIYGNHPDSIEELVRNYLLQYQPVCQEEIRMLSEELDSIIESRNLPGEPLSEEELDEIVHAVCEELERATYSVPEQEIQKIAYQIIRSYKGQTEAEEPAQYQSESADTEKKSGISAMEKEPGITGKDIRRIASSLDWTEDEINDLIRGNLSITDKTLKETADALGISIHDLNRMIAESREYTDSLYLSLADALSADASQLKMLAGQSENAAGNIIYLARKLKITEGKLNAEIAKSKALSDSEIEALARELQISAEDLQKLIWQNMELADDNISQMSRLLSMNIDSFKEQTGKAFFDMEKEIGNGIRRLEEADHSLAQSMSEASDAAKASLEETKNNLQGMIDGNQASIAATSQALREAEAALGEGLENIRDDLAAQEERTEQGIGDIHNRINIIQGTLETYQWEMDASGTTRLTVIIPREEGDSR